MPVNIEEADDNKSSKGGCCLCCCKPKRTKRSEQGRLNGERLATHTESTTPPAGDELLLNTNIIQPDDIADGKAVKQQTTVHEEKECRKNCIECCKRFTTFLFSNVGLCSAVVAYSILGGFVFKNLEAPNEILKRYHVNALRSLYAKQLWNLSVINNIFYEENYTIAAEKILVQFQKDVLEAKQNGWDGSDIDETDKQQWSFAGSLLYSVTVITTIGNRFQTFSTTFHS